MEIKNIGYNFGEVTIDTALTSGTPAELGTLDELKKIYDIAAAGGVIRMNANIGGTDMSGACFANPFGPAEARGVDIAGVTNFGGSPSVVHGTLYTESGKMYGVVTITSLANANNAKSVKK